jgi:MSHA type pilus biogenesis protein MshL
MKGLRAVKRDPGAPTVERDRGVRWVRWAALASVGLCLGVGSARPEVALHPVALNPIALDSAALRLDQPVSSFHASHVSAENAFLAVSRAYGVTFDVEPGLRGDLSVEVSGGRVRDLVDTLAQLLGAEWEVNGRLISIRRNVLRFYEIDYPQMTRSASGTSTVVLAAQTPTATTGNNAAGLANSALLNSAAGNGSAITATDQTNLSLQQQNQNTFWADVTAELNGLARPGESIAVNKLAGVALVTAPPARQDDFRAFIRLLNRRIARQVRISAKVLEVALTSEGSLGVDWNQAATQAGGLTFGPLSSATAVSVVNGAALTAPTFTGTIAVGKISAVVHALASQGDVHAVSNPSVLTLNNQTAFVKVGTEQTFFSLANSTTLNQPGVTTPFSSTQNSYAQNAITIGTVLYVTPEVNADDSVTVDVLPAITNLIGVDSSPDGQQTAPRMDIKALSTLARLQAGVAVMIGGLIHDETDKTVQQIPGLASLPMIGRLFETRATTHSRTELVIFLTAEIMP